MDTDVRPNPAPFKYEQPELKRNKSVRILDRTDILVGAVHVVKEGGETNLHSHPHVDGFWFVLAGHARFYTTDDEVIGDLGPHEGILTPRGFPYWFESTGEEILEILQVGATDDSDKLLDRVDLTSRAGGPIKLGDAGDIV